MTTTQIIMLVMAAVLVAALLFIFIYANVRKAPAGVTPDTEKNPFVKAYNWIFGSRKAKKFDGIFEAMYYSPHRWVMDAIFVFVIFAVLVSMSSDLDIFGNLSNNSAWETLGSRLKRLFSPDWHYFLGNGDFNFKEGVLYQLVQTFGIGFLSTLIASLLAVPFGILASHKLCGKKAFISETFLIIIRTFPEVLLAIVMVGLTGMNPMTGVIALGLHSIGMVGKLYSEQIDEIDFVPLEAIEAAGGTTFQRITEGIMPQFKPGMISVAIYRFDINLRTSAILGMVVGADCGIGFSLSNHSKGNLDSLLGADILGIVALIVIVDIISSYLRKKLV